MKRTLALSVSAAFLSICCIPAKAETPCGARDLREVLNNYDIISPDNVVRNNVKRSAPLRDPSGYNSIKELSFNALGRSFRLYLTPNSSVLSRSFKAYGLSRGEASTIYVNPEEVYGGHVFGALYSRITLQFDDDNAMLGSVEVDGDIFMLEPAWRHIPDTSGGDSLIYRTADIVAGYEDRVASYCAFTKAFEDQAHSSSDELFYLNTSIKFEARARRSQNVDHEEDFHYDYLEIDFKSQLVNDSLVAKVFPKNRCSLKLVADYSFFKAIGAENEAITIRYLIGLIDRVNNIFLPTVWRDTEEEAGFTNMGFVIKQIVVLQSPNQTLGHYNTGPFDKITSATELLSNFSHFEGSEDFCLVHLFTFRPLKDRVLGLGYIASEEYRLAGEKIINGRMETCNTALSSLQSSTGGAVITREADIVTAHELGHNWGASHDVDQEECNPPLSRGGVYIMNPYSVNGFDANNRRFSICSIRSVKAVLLTKHTLCFEESSRSFCGNERLEELEQCDAGLIGINGNDPCCSATCRLREGAQCSPRNSPCCNAECRFSAGRICTSAEPLSCKEASVCSSAGSCLEPLNVPNKTKCLDGGECRNGSCLSFCESVGDLNFKPCLCENATQSCLRCCLTNKNVCEPVANPVSKKPDFLSKGTRCRRGICNGEGQCEEEVQDVVRHLWRIIEKLDRNTFVKFMRNNLVGLLVVITLIFWIPVCILINKIDKQREAERLRQIEWIRSDSLVADRNRVYIVEGVKTTGYSPYGTIVRQRSVVI